MDTFPSGTATPIGRAVTAEIRARLAAQRIPARSLAERIGVSQNYLAKRLRDEAPLTLDDVDKISDVFEIEAHELTRAAYETYYEGFWIELHDLSEGSRRTDLAIAADEQGSIAAEQESTNET